ncbi:hypothetical protein CHS0354_023771 [Potamilus streckersoni]|uniref:Undecaprenyldiphospho-muramoylpentapeptide beta-N-acetylglucosaminyltransferase n=1 Tax=Potamilus streckersoni TaxID=2493646 RepID=A0AAE0RYT8_9BIVA|nr:hypothetical protein CHS0354_023771 [Potamilus streckersoni]
MSKNKLYLDDFYKGYLSPVLSVGLTVGLIAIEPNFSTASMILLIGLVTMFLGGVRLKHLLITGVVFMGVAVVFLFQASYRVKRLVSFVGLGTKMDTHQLEQALIGLGSGGTFGIGLGESLQREFLPLSYNDFIFAIIGEELGFIGCAIIVALYVVVLICGVSISKDAETQFGKILALGITFSLGLYAIVNMSVATGLLPTTGVVLPFISYGGSSMISNCFGVGLLISISRKDKSNKKIKENKNLKNIVEDGNNDKDEGRGGTGGHLFAGLAVAEALLRNEKNIKISFCGTRAGIEKNIVPKHGYELDYTGILPLQRGTSMRAILNNVKFPFKLLASLYECWKILNKRSPVAVVIGIGGYASFAMVAVAQLRRVLTVIQEQNSDFGLANKILIRKAKEVYVSFEKTKHRANANQKKCYYFGNPTRLKISILKKDAISEFAFDESRRTLLVFGGSLGAKSINDAVSLWLNELTEFNVIWQTGKNEFEKICEKIKRNSMNHVRVFEFISDMNTAYQASDLVICRAGASTVSELKNYGVPAVLVPYPYAAGNHQNHNAMEIEENEAGIVIQNHDLIRRKNEVIGLLHDAEKLQKYRENMLKMAMPNSAHDISIRILNIAKEK